jgi:hypothetical protein
MVRTTPPRPVNVLDDFPELGPMARTALRLHPRVGSPTVTDNSVGGPLLWPSDEPWPVCQKPHPPGWKYEPASPAAIRLHRRLFQQGRDRGGYPNASFLSEEDQAQLSAAADADARRDHDDPTPMIPILQLYLRDAHGVVSAPGGADLLQILWCPFDHEPQYLPAAAIRWRRSTDVTDPLSVQPEPTLIGRQYYLPTMCVLHPEPVTEYPAAHMLPDELWERIEAHKEAWEDAGVWYYEFDLAVAPGWKIGGWGPWSQTDPVPMVCPECGSEEQPLLYADSSEWDGGTGSWIPLEDREPDAWPHDWPNAGDQVQISIGRDIGMQIYTCPTSYDHPHIEYRQ